MNNIAPLGSRTEGRFRKVDRTGPPCFLRERLLMALLDVRSVLLSISFSQEQW
uniref:Uncharacterized protein n=1 Tax=Picea glauca TaxID=3330 RepID=A0A117NHE2_PICGL|nr:hypothetical protein ABT39_MTgene5166 [Picea glauca]